MVVDTLAARWGVPMDREAHHAYIGSAAVGGERVLLVKPQTYMNLAGQAAASVARYYRLAPADFVAIYDEMDLPLGRVRVRRAGGAAGHRGLTSLISQLGDRGFPRVRLGIGRPPPGWDPADYVLARFARNEQDVLAAAVARAAEAVEMLIVEGPECAMNRFNAPGTCGEP
jgi:PTH1 family peptidyl-tRNA hydrolase